MTETNQHLDLASFSARLGDEGRPAFWRSLEELSRDPSFEEVMTREFPRESALLGELGRRDFLRLMGASVAMGGLAACAQPVETIVPYVEAPEDVIPGKPLFYATALALRGVATGVLVESHMGRPTKVEGNPDHPGSLGGTSHWDQASVLALYDPDRSGTVREVGEVSTWANFISALQAALQPTRARGGEGVRILTESLTSPTFGEQMRTLRERYPRAVWHTWQPVSGDNPREGARLAFGAPVHTVYRFDQADLVLSLDADFTFSGPGFVRYARDFMNRRRVRRGSESMNRLYVAESMPTPTGTMADHRLPLPASQVEALARAIAAGLGIGSAPPAGPHAEWAAAVARDLRDNAGRSIVVAGEAQPPAVHALAHAMNATLGNTGTTLYQTDPIELNPVNQRDSLRQLVTDMSAGRVDVLVVLGGNPAFTAPADVPFAAAMEKVPFRAHLSTDYDETSALSHWHVPAAHSLEQWSDARAYDGTASIVQPLIQPLYNGHSIHEVVGAMNEDVRTPHDMVRDTWRSRAGAGAFEAFWNRILHDGVIPGTALAPREAAVRGVPPATPAPPAGLELVFRPDPMIDDGRWVNNGWLQELPKPVTKLTWDNPAHLSPATAARLGLANGELVRIEAAGRSLELPVWIVPGHADESVTLYFGYGAERSGRVGRGTGFNVYTLRGAETGDIVRGASLTRTGEKVPLATVQAHHELDPSLREGAGTRRHIIQTGTMAQFLADPDSLVHAQPIEGGPSMYPEWPYPRNAWGMVIDSNVCIGCGICTIACQAENNIAVVGKEQVLVGREMHWIRTDHYYKGDPHGAGLEQYNLPIPCMHCENAPCEPVCPVEATTHSDEGLNDMTYNRCVGTRYCANNCPYKVRRFNFFEYTDWDTESYKAMRNPDVTVRSRGVMEKCTYCVQRINAARIESEKEGRGIRDGEVTTACAQACPTRAIWFGNINDAEAEVTKLKSEPLHYGLLTELNTKPRTSYLGTLKNPNPELAAPAGAPGEHAE